MSDFFVDAYDGNNAIIVDDECTWCGSGSDKISYDELKNLWKTVFGDSDDVLAEYVRKKGMTEGT